MQTSIIPRLISGCRPHQPKIDVFNFSLTCGLGISLVSFYFVVLQSFKINPTDPEASFRPLILSKKPQRLCRGDELARGAWHQQTLPSAPYNGEDAVVGQPFSTFSWIPSSSNDREPCQMTKFSPMLFCDATHEHFSVNGTSNIVFLGDSTSGEHYSVLGAQLKKGSPESLKGKVRTSQRVMCGNGNINLHFRRCNELKCAEQLLSNLKPQILILNRGSHVVSMQDLKNDLNEVVVPAVGEWMGACQSSFKVNKCLLVVRTTPPGHPHCGRFTSPSNSSDAMKSLVSSSRNDPAYKAYGWFRFQASNKILVNAFSKVPNTVVLDVYPQMLLRPDRHANPTRGDCLHSQKPGRLEFWNDALLHLILRHVQDAHHDA